MEAPISASHGVMRSLPGMLELLLSDPGHGLHKQGEKKKIRTLKGDLEELIKYLVEPSEVESPALTASSWMKEVRELSYDIHDLVDELINVDDEIQQEEEAPRSHMMISRFQEMFRRHQKVDDEISRFRARVKEAIQLHKDHLTGNLKMWPAASNNKALDWRPAATTAAAAGGHAQQLVGLASSVDELSGMLANDGKPQHKVASIVGVGGVGKTTLANQLYSKLAGQFQCRAFVRTSRKQPDPRRLLSSILSQVRRHQPLPHGLGVPNLANEIKEYLRDKTYFVIIDDLWAPSTWDIVNRALPRGGYCSRILTTTEVEVVARVCCAGNSNYIFRKQLLSDNESRELYSSIVSVHQSDQSPRSLNEVPNEIIKEMGGLPLAIVIMANILARQPARLDQYMKNYSSSMLMTVSDLDGMKQVLNLSYNSLPHCLKACMLYLSLYEECSVIWKNDLVKQWISEGFICAMEGEDKEEVAHRYFDELVDRGMIQPVDTSSNDEVLSCTVHYMVLDMIRYKSIEENFIIAIDHSQTAAILGDKIRRLALHFGNAEDAKPPTSMRLSQVRSLAFSGLFKCMPSIVEFQFLRVLILKLSVDPDDTSYCNLTGISGLFRLRYLHIDACHVTVELPTQMKGLRDLVALEIEAKITAVPSDIIDMPSLLYLSLPSEAHLPTGIGRMAVRTLGFNLSSNSEYSVMDLGNLTNLQDLHLTCSTLDSDNLKNKMQILGSILSTHTKLKSVTLVHSRSYHANTPNDVGVSSTMVSPSPDLFQRVEMSRRCYIFYGLPQWIGKLSKLCILKIAVLGLSTHDFDVLKGLPALIALSLYIHTLPEERIVFTKEGFSFLKYLKLKGNALRVKIEEDAMPNLQKLKLCLNAPRLDEGRTAPISIEHLSSLKEISAKIGGTGGGAHTETNMTTAISSHSSNPRINVQTVDYFLYLDENVKIEENEHRTQGQPILNDEKTKGTSRISFHPESSTNLPPVPANAELTGRNSSRVEDATVSGSTGAKSSSVTVKVDLECPSCYNKIRKVLCKLQDKATMKTIYFDLKNKKVIISGPFDPDKLSHRLECKAGLVIEEIDEVKQQQQQPKSTPPQTTNKKADHQLQLVVVEDNHLEMTSRKNIRNQTATDDKDDIVEIVVDTKKAAEEQQHTTLQPDVPNHDVETTTTVTLGTRQANKQMRFTEVCTVCHLWPCSDPTSHPSRRNNNKKKKIHRSGQQYYCSQHQRNKSIRRLQQVPSPRAHLRSLFFPCSHAFASVTGQLHASTQLRHRRLRHGTPGRLSTNFLTPILNHPDLNPNYRTRNTHTQISSKETRN